MTFKRLLCLFCFHSMEFGLFTNATGIQWFRVKEKRTIRGKNGKFFHNQANAIVRGICFVQRSFSIQN